eukprot:15435011-Alexandrium_andersonii.AAC.1
MAFPRPVATTVCKQPCPGIPHAVCCTARVRPDTSSTDSCAHRDSARRGRNDGSLPVTMPVGRLSMHQQQQGGNGEP